MSATLQARCTHNGRTGAYSQRPAASWLENPRRRAASPWRLDQSISIWVILSALEESNTSRWLKERSAKQTGEGADAGADDDGGMATASTKHDAGGAREASGGAQYLQDVPPRETKAGRWASRHRQLGERP